MLRACLQRQVSPAIVPQPKADREPFKSARHCPLDHDSEEM
jgi:hypothetical protein